MLSLVRRVVALASFTALFAACSSGVLDGVATGTVRDRDAPAPSGGPCANAANRTSLSAKTVLTCLGPSLAFLQTPAASGSGILLADGYVVTNAHVVDPFGFVTITFDGGETYDRVPVLGADVFADIAIVGPVDTDRPPVPIDDFDGLETGDDVYLVGYPGETDADEPEPAISKGILSRTREAKPFGLTYLQTDAAIGGGKSGGALVDSRGRVVGISGLRFAEEFALALGGPDVQAAIARIRAGTAAPYRSLPTSGGVTSGSYRVEDPDLDRGVILLPFGERATTVRLTLETGALATLEVYDLIDGDTRYASRSLLELDGESSGSPGSPPLGAEGGRELAPGVFEVNVPERSYLVAVVGTTTGPADVAFKSSVPVFDLLDRDQRRRIAVGDEVDAVLDYLEDSDTYEIELRAGDRITIFVGSPIADMAYSVIAPGQRYADAELVDDSGLGLLDADAQARFTATVDGTHVIEVIGDGFSSGYRIAITRG